MATFRSPAVALMPDVTPKPLRSKANAIINLMGTFGGIISLGLLAVLAKDFHSYVLVFAVIAVFALAATQKFLNEHQMVILLAGGAILVGIGLNMALKDPFRRMRSDGTSRASATDFLQALFMTISNPGAIFVMLALFAFFGITDNSPSSWRVAPILLSVAGGSVTYWFLISWSLGRFRNKFTVNSLLWVSRVTGALVVIVGIVLLTQALFEIIFHGAPIQ